MEITLKKMKLENFKGIKDLSLNFSKDTTIQGKNGIGKSTLFDAFLWCLFDKNANNEKDFSIKTLDEKGNIIPKLNHSVELVLSIDNEEKIIKKTLTEKYTKKRGQALTVFSGNTISYYVNDVPQKKKEYDLVINSLISESVFKLITNPFYFNNLHWETRRKELEKLISIDEIKNSLLSSKKYSLLSDIAKKQSIDEYNKLLKSKISKMKKDLDAFAIRIDEKSKEINLEVDLKHDYNKDIRKVKNEIAKIDNSLKNVEILENAKAKEIKQHYALITSKEQDAIKLYNLDKEKANKEIHEIKLQINNFEYEISDIKNKLIGLEKSKINYLQERKNKEIEIKELRTNYIEVYNKKPKLDNIETSCPTCGHEFDEFKINEIKTKFTETFNSEKATELKKITDKGKRLSDELNEIVSRIISADKDIASFEKLLRDKKDILKKLNARNIQEVDVPKSDKVLMLEKEIEELKAISFDEVTNSNSDLINKKDELQKTLLEIINNSNTQTIQIAIQNRIKELEEEEVKFAQQIADVEMMQIKAEEYLFELADTIEKSINDKFIGTSVKFKLFHKQINEGLKMTCDTYINGVPFKDANNSSKINAGIEIINVLTKHHEVKAPIWIDNAESITNIIDTDSQIIKLYVSKDASKLTVI